MKHSIILSLLFLFNINLFAQKKLEEHLKIDTSFTEYNTYNNYQKDFYCLQQIMEETHPNIYNKIQKGNYSKIVSSIF